MNTIEKLAPCPFCGSTGAQFERIGTPRQSCIVACNNCGARHESSDEGHACGSSWNDRAQQAGGVPAGWDETVTRIADEWDFERIMVEQMFNDLLPHFLRDPNQTHLWLSIDQLIQEDSYGVWGSEFYRCRICDAESGAGALNNGIQHDRDCPLHDDNFGKLLAAPTPPAVQPLSEAQREPMSDWRAEKMAREWMADSETDAEDLIRQVEDFHGIVTPKEPTP